MVDSLIGLARTVLVVTVATGCTDAAEIATGGFLDDHHRLMAVVKTSFPLSIYFLSFSLPSASFSFGFLSDDLYIDIFIFRSFALPLSLLSVSHDGQSSPLLFLLFSASPGSRPEADRQKARHVSLDLKHHRNTCPPYQKPELAKAREKERERARSAVDISHTHNRAPSTTR